MSGTTHQARIIGTGGYLPENILTNQDLEKLVATSDEWIYTRTGIKERRIARSNEYPSTMGVIAARKALANAMLKPIEVDIVIVATMSADFQSSSSAALIQHEIGATCASAFDLQAACSGFLYALSVAKAYIESGMYRNVLVIASEKMSTFVDYQDRNTCVLFGDGAAAAVVSNRGPGLAITSVTLGSNGGLAELLLVPAGGSRQPTSANTVTERQHYIKMNGKELFKQAVRLMTATAKECLELAGIEEKNLDWVVPHQANERIIDALAKNLELSSEKIFKTVHKYGNTSASSIPIALDELLQQQKLVPNQNILLLGFGAGLTYGAVLLKQI